MTLRRRVMYVQYMNPAGYPPLVHSARLLAGLGFDVLFLGTDALADALTFPRHERIEVRLMPFQARGWRQKIHHARFVSWVLATALAWRPSWVYASDPLSCPAALLLKQLLGRRVVYHEHDSPSREAAEGGVGTRFQRLVMRARRSIARSADVCVLPSAERARRFADTTGRSDALVVWNCPAKAEVSPAAHREADGTLRVLYHGSIVPARVPLSLLDALALTPAAVTLTIIGYETVGHERYTRELFAHAARLGVADRVTVVGPMSRDRLMQRGAGFDLGLALLPMASLDVNEQTMVGASNKSFDYLACGLSLLVSDRPEWVEAFVDAGYGRACDSRSAESIAASLRWFLDHPEERTAMGERGRRKVLSDWNYETTFQPVVERLTASRAGWAERVPSADPIR
jgi:glycosyltransferase involved in cell wall biosynthesis